MKVRSRLGAAAGLVALIALPIGTAQAVEIPSDLEYSYTLSQPIIGQIKSAADTLCYQTKGESFTLSMVAGLDQGLTKAVNTPGNEILCTIRLSRILSNVVLTGTASASAQGQSGSGSFSLNCEVGNTTNSFFSVVTPDPMGMPSFGPNPFGVEGNAYVSCTWSISVDDEQKSQLAGTLEMQGTYTKDSERVSCEEAGITITGPVDNIYCVAYDANIKAFLTGATGAYAGRTGEGSLTQRGYTTITVPLTLTEGCPPDQPNCENSGTGGDSLEGCQYSASQPGNPQGWMQFPPLPPGAPTPPGWQGPGWYKCGGGADVPPSDFDPSIPPCVTDESGAYVPPEGFSNCVQPGSQTTTSTGMLRAVESVVRAGTGQKLALATSKGKVGTTRIVSPAQTTGDAVRPFGASSTSVPTVRIATVPGATCAVTATAGSAKATLVARGAAVGGQLDTKVNAASLRSKLKAAVGTQAVITANCTIKAGKKTIRIPAASVTVKFT